MGFMVDVGEQDQTLSNQMYTMGSLIDSAADRLLILVCEKGPRTLNALLPHCNITAVDLKTD